MKSVSEHVKELFREIPDSEQKRSIMLEITENLEEKVKDLVNDGKSLEDAINRAIVEFGDVSEMKRELSGVNQTKLRKAWLDLVFALGGSFLIIGTVVFTNLYFSPQVVWFPYVGFAILWWPLVRLYQWLAAK